MSTELPDYDPALAARYRQQHWGTLSLGDELRGVAARFADRQALVTDEVVLTYRQLDELTDAFAGGLLVEAGLAPGDAVMFQLGNVFQSVIAYYGTVKAGIRPVCTLPLHGEREIALLAEHTGARAHFIQADHPGQDLPALAARVGLPRVIAIRGGSPDYDRLLEAGRTARARAALALVRVEPDEVVAFQLSGGTTGLPKVAPRRHAEYVYNSRAWADAIGLRTESVALHALPLLHNAGVAAAMQPAHLVGAAFVLAPSADPAMIFEQARRHRVSDIPLTPPAVLIRMLDHPEARHADLRGVLTYVGGQKLAIEIAERMEAELGMRCLQMFGMAEGMFTRTPPDAPEWVRKHTVGTPISTSDEIRICAIGGEEEVADGELGELCCRGPYTIPGYYRAEQHNHSAFSPDGFYRTGDLACRHVIDGRAYYSIEGRIKDVINRGAEKIHAEEVEEVMLAHQDVHNAALVAMPDPVLGERACAFLILEPGAGPITVPELGEFLLGHGLAKYKLPERVEIVTEFPLTNVGKVSKKELRAMLAEKMAAQGAEKVVSAR